MDVLTATDYQEIINDAKTCKDEAEVAALWNELLHDVGFDRKHGYKIVPQKELDDNKKPDLIVKVVRSKEVVLVVECKSVVHDSFTGWHNAETQLSEYLQTLGCQNGIAAVGHKCKFYNLRDNFVSQRRTYDFSHEFEQILHILIAFTQTRTFEM